MDKVLQRTADQVWQILYTDRVVIFRFQPDWQGTIVTESVDPQWTPILSTTFSDSCFSDRYIEPYRHGGPQKAFVNQCFDPPKSSF